MTSASRPPQSTLSRGRRPAACSHPTAPPRTPRHPLCPRLWAWFPGPHWGWSFHPRPAHGPLPYREQNRIRPLCCWRHQETWGDTKGRAGGAGCRTACQAVPGRAPLSTPTHLLLSPRSPLPRAPHFSFVSSVLPRQRQARGEARGGAGDGRARVGASPVPFSPQDPDPCGPPAAPPGDVPTAARAPCPVSASRALPPARPLWPPSPGHSLPGERQPGLRPAREGLGCPLPFGEKPRSSKSGPGLRPSSATSGRWTPAPALCL